MWCIFAELVEHRKKLNHSLIQHISGNLAAQLGRSQQLYEHLLMNIA